MVKPSNIRPNLIDYAKVITMFLVVYGHYVPFSDLEMGDNKIWHIVHVINIFHMPLFFYISGLLFKRKDFEAFFTSIKNTLLIPYLSISVICLIIGWMIYGFIGMFSISSVIRDGVGVATGGDFFSWGSLTFSGPLWFCYSLIIIKLIAHYTISSGKKVGGVILVSLIALYIGNLLPFRFDSSLVGFIFFITGYYSKKVLSILESNRWIEIPVILIGLALVYIDAFINIDFGSRQVMSVNAMYFGKSPLLFYIGAIGGTAVILAISKILSNFKCRAILICSNGMIAILGFQCLLFRIISKIITPSLSYTDSIMTSVVVFILCYLIILFSSRYAPFILGFRKLE